MKHLLPVIVLLTAGITQADAASNYRHKPTHHVEAQTTDRYTAIQVQKALAKKGYYNGAVDGILGPHSREAIRHYQRSKGMNATGMVNDSLIAALHIGDDHGDRYDHRDRDHGRKVPVTVQVQSALAKKGFYRGVVDGVIGHQSQEAIRHYQRSRKLRVTGNIDSGLLRALGLV